MDNRFVEERPVVDGVYDQDGVQVSAEIRRDGKEYGDPVPLEAPLGYTPPPDIMTLIKTMVRNELFQKKLAEEGYETFEEADDFDIEDDPVDPLTPYEKVFEPPPGVDGGRGNGAVKPTADAAPPSDASKPVVSGEKPLPVATQEASVGSEDKSGKGS